MRISMQKKFFVFEISVCIKNIENQLENFYAKIHIHLKILVKFNKLLQFSKTFLYSLIVDGNCDINENI